MNGKMQILCVGNAVFCDAFCALSPDATVKVLRAVTVAEARRLFADNPAIDAIILSDRAEREMDTLELVVEIRRGSSVQMNLYCVVP
jgi:hypothetical protein